jgi:hypothetical protein
MATFVTDTFTDVNSTALESHTGETGATWAKQTGFASQADISTNAAQRNGNQPRYYASGVPGSADYDVQATLKPSDDERDRPSLELRMDPSGDTSYSAMYDAFAGWTLQKRVAGVVTNLGTDGTIHANPDRPVCKLEAVGTAIKFYLDGVQKVSVTDSAVSSAGKAGLGWNSSQFGGVRQQWDTYSATDIGGGGSTSILRQMMQYH